MRMKSPCYRRPVNRHGFTLIELMVTVAIIAILAAVAVPSYRDYVTRGKIPQATNNLAALRVKMEQYYQDHREYPASCASDTVPAPDADDFSYSCSSSDGQSYTLTAEGLGFTYTINEKNEKKTTAAPDGWDSNANCWTTKKGGGC